MVTVFLFVKKFELRQKLQTLTFNQNLVCCFTGQVGIMLKIACCFHYIRGMVFALNQCNLTEIGLTQKKF